MINDKRIINVWTDSKCNWEECTVGELREWIKFSEEPRWGTIKEIYFMDSSLQAPWLRLIFHNNLERDYNSSFGTFIAMK